MISPPAVPLEVLSSAFALVPSARELVGEGCWRDRSCLGGTAEKLAAEKGFGEPFTELASLLVAEGCEPNVAAIAAYWAAERAFGIPPAIERELAGPSDDELAAQELELLANAEEAETRRWYREEFPAIAAARGERPEDNPRWREFGQPIAPTSTEAPAPSTTTAPPPAEDFSRRCDWPEESIRDDYWRFMSAAERELFNAAIERATPHLGERMLAARFAMQRVLDRRVAGRAGRSAA